MCIIHKPNRADYTLTKNFHPILLLECLGKLLKKIIVKLIYWDMAKHALVPTNQFGGCNSSSTLDTGLTLLHDIQLAQQARLKTGLLLFDIQGFFDNVNHNRLTQILEDLGFALELVLWCKSFLKDRSVRLHFNGRNSDPFNFIIGTPQGSPVSPALSILYTSPLLHKMKTRSNALLGMYIDDSAIFACSKDWPTVEETLRNGYHTCIMWLTNVGLNAKPDKTELIYFRRHGECTGCEPPPYIHLPLPSLNMYYRVPCSNTLRYLGFFFDHKLDWK